MLCIGPVEKNCYLVKDYLFPKQPISDSFKLTLSQTRNIRLFKTKGNADGNLMKMGGELFKRVENTVGKGAIAHYEQFLFFKVFSKDLYCRHVKNKGLFGKGLRASAALARSLKLVQLDIFDRWKSLREKASSPDPENIELYGYG